MKRWLLKSERRGTQLDDRVTVHHGDCSAILRTMGADSVDAVVTDPPYALTPKGKKASAGFMGKTWDTGDTAFSVEFWQQVYRVAKPGAHVLAFGGTRTYHRLACAVEDAGFEIRDSISWLYGSGFPKSHNLHGGREGWGTALKPAQELIVVARKPLIGTVAENVLYFGTGAVNIDACRVGDEVRYAAYTSLAPCHGNALGADGTAEARRGTQGEPKEYVGRWPANVVHDGSDEVVVAFPSAPGQLANVSTTASSPKTANVYGKMNREGEASADRRYAEKGATNFAALPGQRRGDKGSAARFFYCAKANKADRAESKHPTVKPQALMRWLCKLVTPPGGTVLDPFAGSGSTGQAALAEGFSAILIEREDEYVADIRRRLSRV